MSSKELEELEAQEELDASDAWRVLVLISRLLQSPFPSMAVPQTFQVSLTDLSKKAYTPKPSDVLERLAALVDEVDEDPWGPLLDAILDVDDTVGVLHLQGNHEDAHELSYRAAGLVALSPLRVLDLGDFATMRLGTIQEEHVRRSIWESIEAAPALAVTQNIFLINAQKSAPQLSQKEQGEAQDKIIDFRTLVPNESYRAAASSLDENASYLLGPGCWLSKDGKLMMLEYRPPKTLDQESLTFRAEVIVSDKSSGRVLVSTELDLEKKGKTFYASFGPWDGPENLLQRLIVRVNQPQETIDIHIQVKNA